MIGDKNYISKCRSYIDFMLSQQQWSGITKSEVERWLDNFQGLELSEIALVYKLITNIIYYSEKDIINALEEGIYNKLFYCKLLNKQIASNFTLSPKALDNVVKDELRKTCFIPLLDNDSPHESSNYISRLLVQQGFIEASQSMFLNHIADNIDRYDRIVIVDDCIGSGDQLFSFLEHKANVTYNGNIISLLEFCSHRNIEIVYLTLFGYQKSVEQIRQKLSNLRICCIRTLTDIHRVFSPDSYIWINENERQSAISLFAKLTTECNIPLLGYKDLDFAFIMHGTIPDWSLPLFWKENSDWNLLIRRKNSNE